MYHENKAIFRKIYDMLSRIYRILVDCKPPTYSELCLAGLLGQAAESVRQRGMPRFVRGLHEINILPHSSLFEGLSRVSAELHTSGVSKCHLWMCQEQRHDRKLPKRPN